MSKRENMKLPLLSGTNVGTAIVILLFLLLFLSSCTQSKESQKIDVDLTKCGYVISLSRSTESDSKLIFLDYEGNILEGYDYSGVSINSLNEYDNKFYMHSSRINEHYKIDEEGKIETFSLLENEHQDGEYIPSWFAVPGKTSLIETMNIGMVDDNYLSSLIYSEENEKHEIILKDQFLNNALEYDDKIFVETYSETSESNGIIVVNKNTGTILKDIRFSNNSISNSSKLILFKDKIVTYGNSNDDRFTKQNSSGIGSLDVNTLEIQEHIFKDNNIIDIYAFDDSLYAVADNNYIYKLDQNLEFLDEMKITNEMFIENYNNQNFHIEKVIDKENKIYVVYLSNNFDDIENIGFIQVYNKSNLDPEEKINISNPNAKKWMGGVIDVIVRDEN